MKETNIRKFWSDFIHWYGWKACAKAWRAFIHWNGWKMCGNACAKGWAAVRKWNGWQRMFCLPPIMVFLLVVPSALGLSLVFWKGMETSLPAYFIYALSAYALIVLVAAMPKLFRKSGEALHRNAVTDRILSDAALRFQLGLYAEQVINFFYGIFKIVSGVLWGSAWIGADGIYNLTQGIIQLFQILKRRKNPTLQQQWKSYRFCGWLTLFMHLTLTGLVFQMVNWGRSEDYPGYMIFATAAFAFYKLISSFIDVAKDRKHKAPVDSAVRLLDLSQAFFSIFSLQTALFHAFGEGLAYEQHMNLITGCAVCLLVVAMGIYMIRRANRELACLTSAGMLQ